MLEYLFNFLEENIILVFFCVLILGIASIYSKGIKSLFVFLLCGTAFYFMLLCLYRLGIGVESLYIWSSKWVVMICNQIHYYSFLGTSQLVFLPHVLELLTHQQIPNYIVVLFETIFLLILILFVVEVYKIKLLWIKPNNASIKINKHNKNFYFTNTINRVSSTFFFNCVLRC